MHHYAAIMFLAGIGIPILAALNAALGRFIVSPIVAAAILFTIAGLVTWALAFATGLNPIENCWSCAKASVFCRRTHRILCSLDHIYRAKIWCGKRCLLCFVGTVGQRRGN